MKKTSFTCGNIIISPMVIGPIQTNVYVVSNDKGAFVVDPADDCPRILRELETAVAACGECGSRAERTAHAECTGQNAAPHAGLLDAIVVTHAHFDHTGALAQLRQETGASVIASAIDASAIENPQASASSSLPPVEKCAVDCTLSDGDTIDLCGITWRAFVTPGHTPGSMCLYASASELGADHGVLFSGDTLFKGAFGRTDFPGGSMSAMAASLRRLQQLPANTLVLPGHMQFTEIGAEQNDVFRRIG